MHQLLKLIMHNVVFVCRGLPCMSVVRSSVLGLWVVGSCGILWSGCRFLGGRGFAFRFRFGDGIGCPAVIGGGISYCCSRNLSLVILWFVHSDLPTPSFSTVAPGSWPALGRASPGAAPSPDWSNRHGASFAYRWIADTYCMSPFLCLAGWEHSMPSTPCLHPSGSIWSWPLSH